MRRLHDYMLLSVVMVGWTAVSMQGVAMGMEGLVINEFNVQGASQYVELYDGGVGGTSLDGPVLVLYSGASETIYSQPLVLDGYQTDEEGYFLVSFGTALPNANVTSSTVLITSGLNAIAVYNMSSGNLRVGSMVTDAGLVDAVVYGSSASPQDSALITILSKGQDPLQKDGSSLGGPETSLSRCRGWKQIMHSSFRTAKQTPGTDNKCTLPSFVLNELNPNREFDGEQFVEIFDGGTGMQSLDGVVLVTYAGRRPQDNVLLSVDLTGYSTDENGFLIVAGDWTDLGDVSVPHYGHSNVFLTNSYPAGLTLQLGPPQKFARNAPISNDNLIDAIVYGREVDLPLIHWLTPGQDMHIDSPSTDGRDYSISRCYCCSPRNSSAFGRAPISPRAVNRDCSIANRSVIETPVASVLRINEVHIGAPGSADGDFIEIYDGGYGPETLAGKVLVVFAGSQDGGRSYQVVDLSHATTDARGYLLIASSSVSPAPGQVMTDDDWIRSGLDAQQTTGAAALYQGGAVGFQVGGQPTVVGLLDAVVFGNQSTMTSSLLSALLPGQTLIHDFLPDTSSSALRCYSHASLDQASFAPGPPSPAAANSCPDPPVVINELNVLLTSSTGIWIEFSSQPHFPMDYIFPVAWTPGDPPSGRSRSFNGRTNEDGFMSAELWHLAPYSLTGSFGVALYFSKDVTDLYDQEGALRFTNEGLIDAVVVGREDAPTDHTLLDVLTPGRPQVHEREAFSHRDESLSRCMINGSWTFVPAHVSRDAPNHCPTRMNPDVIINEINLDTDNQFIELFDLGVGYTILDEFVLVLFGGNAVVSEVISLSGYATDAYGYFVLGVQSVLNLGKVDYPLAVGLMDSTVGAVALYRSNGSTFYLTLGDRPTNQGLIDAVVYANNGTNIDVTLGMMISDEPAKALSSESERFSRCFSGDLRSSRAFGSRPATIAAMNDCPVFADDVIINELNFGMPFLEPLAFVELYDGGRGNTALTYLSLVMFSASDKNGAYLAVDLSGYSTNEDGYFLVGSAPASDIVITLERTSGIWFMSTGAGAAALYRSHPGVFHHGASATKQSLVDAVVYTTDAEAETTLVDDLLPPGSFIIYEDESHEKDDGFDESVSRCFDDSRLTQSAYKLAPPTPRERNACGSKGPVPHGGEIFINEVNIKAASGYGFVELYDGGVGDTLLDGYVLVFFDGNNRDRSFYEVDLTGQRSGSSGYFVIGGTAVTPTPDMIANGLSIPPGPGAVALYQDSLESFPRGTVATKHYLIDVVVYGDPQDRADGLIDKLVPGQIQAYENSDLLPGADVSLSRCISRSTLTVTTFVSALRTPGFPNNCTFYAVNINEISPGGSPTERFVELYDGGRGYTSLDALVLFLFNEGNNVPYGVVPLTGNRTSSEGYYLIYGALGLDQEFRSNSTVALYRGDYAKFSTAQAPNASALVDRQTYNAEGIDIKLLMGSSSVPGKAFSRCASCRSPDSSYLALAPVTPGTANQCPSPDYSNQISVKLTDASYDAWKSDNSLVAELEGIIADGVNSRCRCGFSPEYFCGTKVLPGSVVYRAEMYSTDADQSELLSDSFQGFLKEADTVNVGGKDYTVDEAGDSNIVPYNGLSVAGIVVIVVVCAMIVVVAVVVVSFIIRRRRRKGERLEDAITL